MQHERISVIIPCFNYGHLIADTIDSLLAQTYKNIEIIVVDDGSTDDTAKIVSAFAAKYQFIRYIKQDNAGPSAARNNGIKQCKGNYVQFLDADDLLENRKFEIELQIFGQKPQLDIVYGSVRYFTHDAFDAADRLLTYWGANEEWMPKLTGTGAEILPRALKGNFAHLSSVLFKKQIIDKVGFFDENKRIAEDYEFLIRCAIAGANFYYHDDEFTYSLVRWHQNNVSRDTFKMRVGERDMRQQIQPLLINFPEAGKNNNNAIKALSIMLSSSWKRFFLSGGSFDALKKPIRLLKLEKLFLKFFYH